VWKTKLREDVLPESDLEMALYNFQFTLFLSFISTCLYIQDIAGTLLPQPTTNDINNNLTNVSYRGI